jgi:hypothetical protein
VTESADRAAKSSHGDDTGDSVPPAAAQRGEKRTVRILVSSRAAAFGTLAGYVFGGMGFYTNFFESILQATAFLVDTAAVLVISAVLLTGAGRNIWRQAGPRRTLAGVALTVVLVAGVNYLGFRPPGVVPAPTAETCTYDVAATDGIAIPLRPGGSITQRLRPLANRINSVSIVAGLDERTAQTARPHPLRLVVRTPDQRINQPLQRPNLVNNGFSRFEFPQPLKVRPRQSLVIEAFNDSDQTVSFYVKKPDPSDNADGAMGWAFIQGHVDNESGYEKTGYVLSGCVTRPGI